MDVLGELLDVPAEQRAARATELCGADSALRDRVVELLNGLRETVAGETANQEPFSFVPSTEPLGVTATHPAPQRIASYRIVRLLGAGGMGEVYEAEQDRPRRRIALKLMRAGRMSPAMLRRFEYEAEWLGRLDHPGVARVYEAGAVETPAGRQPYFAMEFIDGQRLDRWLTANASIDRARRVRLLIEICNAVHHAHLKGVIHRDLKPANILVTADGQPKILDFGVARALGDAASSGDALTQVTADGTLVGTLQYMSPEQAAGDPRQLDTRTDVYSLGAIAFETLAPDARKPYELAGVPLGEALRIIQHVDPPRLGSLDRALRGDLETIVAKALVKEKSQRYGSAGDFAADLERFLKSEPVLARPPTLRYQFGKFARRHKALVGASGIAVVALCAGVTAATWGLLQARQQRAQAERRRDEAIAVNEFLTVDVLSGVDPARVPDLAVRETIVSKMIDPAAKRAGERFKDRPLVEAAVRNTLASAYYAIGRGDLGLEQARRAYELRRRELGDDHQDTIGALGALGALLLDQGNVTEAEPMLRQAADRSRRVLGPDHADTLSAVNNLGFLLKAEGKFDESEVLWRDTLERRRRVLAPDDEATLVSMRNLAGLFQVQEKFDQAEPLLREALERSRRALGEDHPETLAAIRQLGMILRLEGKLADAEPLCRQAVEGSRRVLGSDHPETITALNNLAGNLNAQGKLEAAEPVYREALERLRRTVGEANRDRVLATFNLGLLLESLDRVAEAEPLAAEVYRRAPELKASDRDTARLMVPYGRCLAKLGRYADAEAPLREAKARLEAAGMGDSERMREVIGALVTVYEKTGRAADAEALRLEIAGQHRPSTSQANLR